jgi:hypothetical protein
VGLDHHPHLPVTTEDSVGQHSLEVNPNPLYHRPEDRSPSTTSRRGPRPSGTE